MAQEGQQQEPIIRVGGESFSLSESQTGAFGVTKAELQMILLLLLRKNKSGQCSQRPLFARLLSQMRIRASEHARQTLLKIYIENLRELRDTGKVEFVSGKTRLNIRLVKP